MVSTSKDNPTSPDATAGANAAASAAAATTASTASTTSNATGAETARKNVRLAYSATLADRVLYADGVHGIALRAGVAQIDLYQVVTSGNDKQPEQRVISQRLALPLNALNELAGILGKINQSVSSAQAAKQA